MSMEAIDSGQVKNLALGGIVVVVLAAVLWTQRSSVENRIKNCNSNVSFLGFHVSLSTSDLQKCQQVVNH